MHHFLFAKFFTNDTGSECYREESVTQSKLEIEHVPYKAQFYMFASHHRETLLHQNQMLFTGLPPRKRASKRSFNY